MNYRRALIGVVASASLLGTAGAAHATHQDPGYSPCRPGEDDLRLGYSDEADRSDPRHELPTVYANGDPEGGSTEGNVGVCGGGSQGQPVQSIEVGNDADDGPYVDHTDPTLPTAATNTPADDLGTVNVGEDHIEVDGTDGNKPSNTHEWLDGYVSVGLTEHDEEPGICMSGDNNHEYYEAQPQQKDCNEELLAAAAATVQG